MISLPLIACAIGYLFGSIPFGLLLTRLFGMGDIRAIGSGNIGATNVLRTGSKKLAATVLLLDGIKGAVPIVLFKYAPMGKMLNLFILPANSDSRSAGLIGIFIILLLPALAGLFAIFGHMFPVWLKFKGGKGVATTFGVYLALSWKLGLVVIACWLLVFALTRISSLAAIIAIGLAAPLYCFIAFPGLVLPWLAATIIGLLVISRHHANIRRLLKGEEPKFGGTGK